MERYLSNEANSPEKKEVIVAVAAKADDGTIFYAEGKRHYEIFEDMKKAGKVLSRDGDEEGFITSTGRYVGRKEALTIQINAGIESVDKDGYGRQLLSEDLF